MAPGVGTVVVDNASSDQTLELLRARSGTRVISNPKNRGFAAAVNQGVREAGESDFVLLLNPDVELETPVDALIEACSRPGIGIAAGLLRDAHGNVQTGFTARRFPTAATLAARLWESTVFSRETVGTGRIVI